MNIHKILHSLLLLFISSISADIQAKTYYTSTSGNDTWAGTLNSPFKTISKGMQVLMAGDTLYVRGGTYREDIEHTGNSGTSSNYIMVMAYGTEKPVIKGSQAVTGWINHSGSIWKKKGWTINSQQVFIDFDVNPGTSLQQIGMPSQFYTSWEYPSPVGSGLSNMAAGTFYYSAADTTLYVWLKDGSNPNNHIVEVSVLKRLLFMHKNYVRLKGLYFRHSNSSAETQQGAAVTLSTGSVMEQCDVQWTDFAGISLPYLGYDGLIRNCNVSNNGNSGINAAASNNYRVTGNTMIGNNYRKFNQLWHAGGLKSAADSYGTIEMNEVANNNGSGIWLDYDDAGGLHVVKNNYIHDNGPKDAAIFFEGSSNALICNNVIVNNARRGIYISASDNARVYNNTLIGCKDRAAIEVAGMPRTGKTLKNNKVFNNIIYNSTAQYDLYMLADNGTDIIGNTADYNCIYRTAGPIQNSRSGSLYTTLASWQSATGWDVNSLSTDPLFLAGSGDDYSLTTSSPLLDKGRTLPEVIDDYRGLSRPQGLYYETGAYEIPLSTSVENNPVNTFSLNFTVAPITDFSILEIRFSAFIGEKIQIRIFDNTGKSIKELQYYIECEESCSRSCNISSLSNGIYYCTLVTGHAVATRKFLVIR